MAGLGGMRNGAKTAQSGGVLKISDHARFVGVDDQIIVADMRSGRYLGLDGVAARVWELIGARAARGAIVERLSTEYEVPPDVLEGDVERLLQDLLERRLIEYEVPALRGAPISKSG